MIPTVSDSIRPHILIIDPDPQIARTLLEILARYSLHGTVASNGALVRECLPRHRWNLIFLSLEWEDGNDSSASWLARIRSQSPETPVIMISRTDSARSAVTALRGGCSEFLVKPLDLGAVEHLLTSYLPARYPSILAAGTTCPSSCYTLVGASSSLRQSVTLAQKIAPTSLSVLIHGESGTGKELFARLIHADSRRAGNAFVRINCAAINDALLESELFGHEKGAFTGAVSRHHGRFERANGGTLLLDEITETSPAFQAKLLRVLEEMDFERVGGKENIRVNVRILSTTNTDILARLATGQFRKDLYYRLAGLRLFIPPLRQRPEDIPQLIWLFVSQFAAETRRRIASIDSDCLEILCRHPWPGNVRQLRNVIRTLMVLGSGEVLTLDDVPSVREELTLPIPFDHSESPNRVAAATSSDQTLEQVEQIAILAALDRARGNQTKAAQALGISNRTLRDKVKRYRQQDCFQTAE